MRQLVENIYVSVISEGSILVIIPFVLEVFFDLLLEFVVQALAPIELYKDTKEFVQFVPFFYLIVVRFELGKDLLKIAHYVWENSNSKKKDQSNEYPLQVTPWIIISKAYRGQWCEHVISNNDSDLIGRLVKEWVVADKILRLVWSRVIQCVVVYVIVKVLDKLNQHVENHTHDVTNVHDYDC